MILCIATSNGRLQLPHELVPVDLRSRVIQLLVKQIHQVLHEVSLSHEQVLADAVTVTLKFILCEEDLQKLLVCYLVSVVHPILKMLEMIGG